MLNPRTRLEDAKSSSVQVVYKLRDYSSDMVKAWEHFFAEYPDGVEISHGDIFKGAPQADAIVSPANSFGFMDGGIDMHYSNHFGWQMMNRLQVEITKQKHGELLVGDALIICAFGDDSKETEETKGIYQKVKGSREVFIFNQGTPIKYLISAPTMRVPQDCQQTVNAYLAFRAVILAVQNHNADSSKEPIRSVLCPGLCTAVGRMPKMQCAKQMLIAYETFEAGKHPDRIAPKDLRQMFLDQDSMIDVPECAACIEK